MKKDKTAFQKARANPIVSFLFPTKWKIILGVFLYFSNYLSFFGTAINYPIFYFYWYYTFDGFGYFILFISHLVYIYLLSSLVVWIFS